MTDPGDENQQNDIVDRLRRMSNGLTPRSESDVIVNLPWTALTDPRKSAHFSLLLETRRSAVISIGSLEPPLSGENSPAAAAGPAASTQMKQIPAVVMRRAVCISVLCMWLRLGVSILDTGYSMLD